MRIAVVLGTRPEAVKLSPLIHALRARDGWETIVVATAQHRSLLDQALGMFDIRPDVDLDLMVPNQSLPSLTSRVLLGAAQTLADLHSDLVIVQGDTTTVFAAALAAFYANVPVGHVEAGLRTKILRQPFPEEANRRLTSVLATLHFAPTVWARDQLLAEGVAAESVVVTGNTVVDALQWIQAREPAGHSRQSRPVPERVEAGRRILFTLHRRENHGCELERICDALRRIAARFPDVELRYPVHPNPNVSEPVTRLLGATPGITLLPPLDYAHFVQEMSRATLIVTDSGGVQEEAPTFGTPVLVLRESTERPEACYAGTARLVGTDPDTIVSEVSRLLTDAEAYRAMAGRGNPFGDGRATARIVRALERWRVGESPLLSEQESFTYSRGLDAAVPRPVEARQPSSVAARKAS